MDTKVILRYVIVILVLWIIVVLLHKAACQQSETVIQKIDTLVVHDTLRINKTINHVKYKYDTIHIYDTITKQEIVYIKDSAQLYKDSTSEYSLNINAVKLYSYDLNIYKSDTVYKYLEKQKKPKFGQSVTIGPSFSYGYSFTSHKMEPTVGVSIVWGFGVTF